jgi:hypothetical protein
LNCKKNDLILATTGSINCPTKSTNKTASHFIIGSKNIFDSSTKQRSILKSSNKNTCPTPGCNGKGNSRGGLKHWSIGSCPNRTKSQRNVQFVTPSFRVSSDEEQESDEITRLKDKIEQLETKVKSFNNAQVFQIVSRVYSN